MKRSLFVVTVILSMFICLQLWGCNKPEKPNETKSNESQESIVESSESKIESKEENKPSSLGSSFTSLKDVIKAIDSDAEILIEKVGDQYDSLEAVIGDDIGKYKDNYTLITGLYESIDSHMKVFQEQLDINIEEYFRLMLELHSGDNKSIDKALDDFYDKVYSGTLDDLYDEIYSGILDDVFDDYFSGLLSDAYNSLPQDEWSDIRLKFQNEWSAASSAFHQDWSDARTRVLTFWSSIRSGVKKTYDYDTLINEARAAADEKQKELDAERQKEAERDALREKAVKTEVRYEIRDGKAYVVGSSGSGNEISISSSYQGKDVVGIDAAAFKDCKDLWFVTIWADIESIGDYAFANCTALLEISIPSDTTEIGAHAFENCTSLDELYIWGSPTIGDYAFAKCIGISEVSISSGTKSVGAHAYEGCTGVKELYIWGVDEIGAYAFAGCTGITELSIPSDVQVVRTHAFDGCSELETVYVWGDTIIEKHAFDNCPKLSKRPAESEIQASQETNPSEIQPDDEPGTVFEPQDVSDETIESIKTYGDYLTMYRMVLNDYYANYEQTVKGTPLYNESTFKSIKDCYDKAFEQQEKAYGNMKNAPLVGKEDLVDFLKSTRDDLRASVESIKETLKSLGY